MYRFARSRCHSTISLGDVILWSTIFFFEAWLPHNLPNPMSMSSSLRQVPTASSPALIPGLAPAPKLAIAFEKPVARPRIVNHFFTFPIGIGRSHRMFSSSSPTHRVVGQGTSETWLKHDPSPHPFCSFHVLRACRPTCRWERCFGTGKVQ